MSEAASLAVEKSSEIPVQREETVEIPYELIKECVEEIIKDDLDVDKITEIVSNSVAKSIREKIFGGIGKMKIIHKEVRIDTFNVEMLNNELEGFRLVLNSKDLPYHSGAHYLLFEKVTYE